MAEGCYEVDSDHALPTAGVMNNCLVFSRNRYWKHQVKRHEAARIVLQGRSEFEAQNVVISGDQTFTVPDGFRMVVSQVWLIRKSGFDHSLSLIIYPS